MFDLTNGEKSENNSVHYQSDWIDYRLDKYFHGRMTFSGNSAIYLLSLGALKLSKMLFKFVEHSFSGALEDTIGGYSVSMVNNYDDNICVKISSSKNETGIDCFFNVNKKHLPKLCAYLREQAAIK